MLRARYILNKIFVRFLVFFAILTFTFVIPRLMPGGAFAYLIENPNISPELRQSLIRRFDLDKPIYIQYLAFLRQFFTRGDLGISFRYLKPVSEVIMQALPWTILLVTTSVVISFLLGILIGSYAAFKRGSRLDSFAVTFSVVFRSMPGFWLALVLLIVFGYYLGLAPLYGAYTYGATYKSFLDFALDVAGHLWLPMLVLVLIQLPTSFMLARNLLIDVLTEDFIAVAKAKGLPPRYVLFRHAVRASLPPLTTFLAINLGTSISGALLIETVFSLPGVGKLMYDAVYMTDYPLLLGIVVYTSALTLILVTMVEILHAYLDPRVSKG